MAHAWSQWFYDLSNPHCLLVVPCLKSWLPSPQDKNENLILRMSEKKTKPKLPLILPEDQAPSGSALQDHTQGSPDAEPSMAPGSTILHCKDLHCLL